MLAESVDLVGTERFPSPLRGRWAPSKREIAGAASLFRCEGACSRLPGRPTSRCGRQATATTLPEAHTAASAVDSSTARARASPAP
jgi:hypothetical protein